MLHSSQFYKASVIAKTDHSVELTGKPSLPSIYTINAIFACFKPIRKKVINNMKAKKDFPALTNAIITLSLTEPNNIFQGLAVVNGARSI